MPFHATGPLYGSTRHRADDYNLGGPKILPVSKLFCWFCVLSFGRWTKCSCMQVGCDVLNQTEDLHTWVLPHENSELHCTPPQILAAVHTWGSNRQTISPIFLSIFAFSQRGASFLSMGISVLKLLCMCSDLKGVSYRGFSRYIVFSGSWRLVE